MSTLAWIVAACVAGGVLSVIAAALLGRTARDSTVHVLVSFAIGAMLGAVFLEVLPHAIEHSTDVHTLAGTVLAGILVFFVLEKLVLWRHCHVHHCEAHEALPQAHDHGRSGLLVLVGDTVHNFVDGILIAAAFMQDVQLGIVTAFAIVVHEIPQELGDFMVLLHSGYSRPRALLFNALSGLATVVGGVLAYYALSTLQEWIPSLLAFAAASMIYVAVADLIPGLHKRTALAETMQQVALIALGITAVWGVGEFFGHG
jgi:zinc and cadmium transporter